MKKNQDYLNTQDILGLVVHSYNNYLSGIMGFTELALLDREQDEMAERLQSTLFSTNQAVTFGKQLLASIGRLQVRCDELPLLSIVQPLCQKQNCPLSVEKEFDAVVVSNRQWFESCLVELIQFCRDYARATIAAGIEKPSSESSEISVKLYCDEGKAKLQVRCDDLRLSDKQQAHLFEPFYSSRSLLGQSGVGLAMVRGFMRQIKGDLVWLPDQGFEISLPLVSNSVET